ncbi:MAG: DMT family transporter [Pseudomonadota bacterium]
MSLNVYYAIAIAVGVVAGVYLPLNGRFGEQIGSPLLATAVFFCVGAIAAVSVYLIFGDGATKARLANAQPALFGLGVISFSIILCATFFIPRMGPAAYFVCLVAGQVIAGVALSHFGWLSPMRLPLTPLKLLGAIAVVAGVLMIRAVEENQRNAAKAHVTQVDR